MTKDISPEHSHNTTLIVAIISGITIICAAIIGICQIQIPINENAVGVANVVNTSQAVETDTNAVQVAVETVTVSSPGTAAPIATTVIPTSPPIAQLPLVDDFSDGISSEWKVTGRYVIVDGFLKSVERANPVVLELLGVADPNFVVSIGFDDLLYYNLSGSDRSLYITFGDKFRCRFRNYVSRWEAFEDGEWITLDEIDTDYTRGTVALSVDANTYQLLVNGSLVSSVTYGTALTGKILITVGDDVRIDRVEILPR